MAPAGKLPVTDFEKFLMACIDAMPDDIRPDFNKVAAATGMSKGGASNKFGGSLKMYREEKQAASAASTGVLSAPAAPAAAVKVAKKRKAKTDDDDDETKAKKAKVKDNNDEDDATGAGAVGDNGVDAA